MANAGSRDAEERLDSSDPPGVGRMGKAGAKRRRQLESDTAADAGGDLPHEIVFDPARVGEEGTSGARELLFSLLLECNEKGASDLHLATNLQPYLRIHGQLQRMGSRNVLSAEQLHAIVADLLRGNDRTPLDSKGSLDGVMFAPDNMRFRFNISRAQHGLSVAFRRTSSQFKTLSELQLPPQLDQFCALKDGLVILAGPAGAGKSTTAATLLDRINQTRHGHIITIEDPIEFIHQPGSCLVSQRQVGIHASSFNGALVAALRQDPDVIMVGEMRDQNTIRTVLTAAETGHLVFTTLHAADAIGAIERLLSSFSPDDQDYMRRKVAGVLRAIVAQHLLQMRPAAPGAASMRWSGEQWNTPKDRRSNADRRTPANPASSNDERRHSRDRRSSREDRVPACEVLIVTPAIANLIATSQFPQVYAFIESGITSGMQTLDQDLARLCVAGKITERTALEITRRPKMLQSHIAYLARKPGAGAT